MHSFFIRLVLLLLLVPLLIPQAQARPSMDAAMAALPDRLGPLERRGDVVDFEARGAPGLGRGVTYDHPSAPTRASVYIYDAQQTGIPDGANSPAVQRQFDSMRREIRGFYTNGQDGNSAVSEIRQHIIARTPQLALRCLDLRIERNGTANSLACVGGFNGRFLKLRVTMQADIATAYPLAEQLLADLERDAKP